MMKTSENDGCVVPAVGCVSRVTIEESQEVCKPVEKME